MRDEGALVEAQGQAFDDAEDEFIFRKEAFAEISDDEEREDMEHALDYNDQILRGGAGIKMNLFYMCAKHDLESWDASSKCGIYMAGKLWDRRGAAPEKIRSWYCGIEEPEWEALVQSSSCQKQADAEPAGTLTWDTR